MNKVPGKPEKEEFQWHIAGVIIDIKIDNGQVFVNGSLVESAPNSLDSNKPSNLTKGEKS